jgi:nucleotide-binding universal stress UspA family protein
VLGRHDASVNEFEQLGPGADLAAQRIEAQSMIQIKRILCPVDFSACSRHALDEAIAIAHLYDACVTAVHVFPEAIAADPFAGLPEFQPFRLTDRHRAHLLGHLKTFATSEGAEPRRMNFAIREGVDIDSEILAAAEQITPDVIVMGTHGRSGFQRLMLGSVAEKVLRKARCPVLTVSPKAPDAVPAGPTPFSHIVCGTDFSDSSLAALEYATSFAAQSGAQLDVLSVVQLIPIYEMTGAIPLYFPGFIGDLKADIARQLDSTVAGAGIRNDVHCLVTAGTPYREIVRVASERQADLIVLGAYSHGTIDHLFFGSTANHVVRQARCPVLTVRR